MSGVHSIFDDCDKWFSNTVKLLNNNKSRLYIFGIWNDDDVDVIIRMKKSSNKISWEKAQKAPAEARSKANSAYSGRLKLLHDLIAGFEISGDSLDVIIIF